MILENKVDCKAHDVYLNMAECLSRLSHCSVCKDASILVKNGVIIGTGINGTPSGFTNCDDIFDETYSDEHRTFAAKWEISSEMNCLMNSLNRDMSGAFLYCLYIPDVKEIKNIASVNIERIYYRNIHKHTEEEVFEIYDTCSRLGVYIEQVGYI